MKFDSLQGSVNQNQPIPGSNRLSGFHIGFCQDNYTTISLGLDCTSSKMGSALFREIDSCLSQGD